MEVPWIHAYSQARPSGKQCIVVGRDQKELMSKGGKTASSGESLVDFLAAHHRRNGYGLETQQVGGNRGRSGLIHKTRTKDRLGDHNSSKVDLTTKGDRVSR